MLEIWNSQSCISDLHNPHLHVNHVIKHTHWNLRASKAKWEKFAMELNRRGRRAAEIMLTPEIDFQSRYKRWYTQLEKVAWASIGKTTVKDKGKEKFSTMVKHLREQKMELKEKIRHEKSLRDRSILIRKKIKLNRKLKYNSSTDINNR